MVTTSKVEIDPKLLKTIQEIAKDENTNEYKVLNDLIKKGLKKSQDDEIDFFDLEGIITTDKPFSAVEEVKKMRGRE